MQTTATTVLMDAQGRLTIPVEVRQALGIDEGAQFNLALEEGAVILRLVAAIPEEDLWAYTPEHIAQVERARQRPRDQDLRLSEEDLERLAGLRE